MSNTCKPCGRAIAEAHRDALANDLRWKCGPVETQENGEVGFWVEVPATATGPRGRDRKPGGRQIRTFDNRGTMTIIRSPR